MHITERTRSHAGTQTLCMTRSAYHNRKAFQGCCCLHRALHKGPSHKGAIVLRAPAPTTIHLQHPSTTTSNPHPSSSMGNPPLILTRSSLSHNSSSSHSMVGTHNLGMVRAHHTSLHNPHHSSSSHGRRITTHMLNNSHMQVRQHRPHTAILCGEINDGEVLGVCCACVSGVSLLGPVISTRHSLKAS